jgi:hypothetical protein
MAGHNGGSAGDGLAPLVPHEQAQATTAKNKKRKRAIVTAEERHQVSSINDTAWRGSSKRSTA